MNAAPPKTAPPEKLINLLRGWPAPSLLPTESLNNAANTILTDPTLSTPSLEYGPDAGFEPLRMSLAQWLTSQYVPSSPDGQKVDPDAERICITGGASQGLACILASFTDPAYTKGVWLAAPCYYLACPIFEDAGLGERVKAVKEDGDGIGLVGLERRMIEAEQQESGDKPFKQALNRKLYRHVIYIVPTCSNPSGITMPLQRRIDLVQLARRRNALVICDDVYDFLQWPITSPLPPKDQNQTIAPPRLPLVPLLPRLSDIDRSLGPAPNDPHGFGHAISNGSFSKIVGPGVRTGWVEGTPAFAHGLSTTGSSRSGGAPSQLSASFMWQLLTTDDLASHLENLVRPALYARYCTLQGAIDRHLVPLGVRPGVDDAPITSVYGGYFIWLKLPEDVLADVLVKRSQDEQNLIVAGGDIFEVHGDEAAARFRHHIRLCFAYESLENIVEGVARLAKVLSDIRG